MTRAKKALSQAVLLISGAIMLGFGAMRGEVETVLSKQSTDSSISTLMATEPSDADEALKLYNQLMKKENEILSTDKALWEKVFMASNKETPMIEDGTNYGDFLLKTIESAKDQFTDEEYKKLVAGAEQIKEIEGKLTILEQKYPECAKVPGNGDSVPADSNGVVSNSSDATSFPFQMQADMSMEEPPANPLPEVPFVLAYPEATAAIPPA